MRINKSLILGMLSLLLLSAASGNAAVYQWTDSNGNVHYADQPGASNAKPVTIDEAPITTDGDVTQRNQALIEKQKQDKENSQKTAAQQEEQKKQQAYDEQRKMACQTSKNNLNMLQEGRRRAYTVDSKGEYHYFSDDERQQEIQRLQAKIKQYCQ